MIEIENITAGYEDTSGRLALKELSAILPDRKLTVIIGPNGSGKSTLLRTIMRFLPLRAGKILHDGSDFAAMSEREIAKRTAFLPQSRPVPQIRVREMVLHGRFPYLSFPRQYSRHDHEIVREALHDADAADLEKQYMHELSGGQRQKVYIAMALAQQTQNILMDEPTTYLDIRHQYETMRLLKRIAQEGRCAVAVLHDLGMAFGFADQMIVLEQGMIRCQGTPKEVYDYGIVPEVFGVNLLQVTDETGDVNYYTKELTT